MDGWFRLHRKILDNPIVCKDGEHLAVWIYLLANATYTSYDMYFSGKRITLKAGQLITGRKSIAKKLKISESKVQRILKLFENERQIEQQTTSKNRLITIKNWDKYQMTEQLIEQQLNNHRTASEQQLNTNNKYKNIINNKNNSSCGSLQEVIDFYNNNIGMITSYGLEVLSDYAKEMPIDLIIYAMKIAVEANKRTIQYIRGILNNWNKKGIKTLVEAKQENQKYNKNKKQNSKNTDWGKMYDDLIKKEGEQT